MYKIPSTHLLLLPRFAKEERGTRRERARRRKPLVTSEAELLVVMELHPMKMDLEQDFALPVAATLGWLYVFDCFTMLQGEELRSCASCCCCQPAGPRRPPPRRRC